MAKRFVYFYFTKRKPPEMADCVPRHIDYWKKAGLPGYMGGPFTDKTGGLITFESKDMEKAEEVIEKDPFVKEELIEYKWVKEWFIE